MPAEKKPVPESKEEFNNEAEFKNKYTAKKSEEVREWQYVGPTSDKLVLIATDVKDLTTYRLSEDGKTPKGLPVNWSEAIAEFAENPDDITLRLWRFGIYKPVFVDTQVHQFIRALASRFLVSHAKHDDINKFENQLLAIIKKD